MTSNHVRSLVHASSRRQSSRDSPVLRGSLQIRDTIALDFIIKLPVSQGFDSILTVTDQGCTKAAIFIPCNEDITAEETAAHVCPLWTTLSRFSLAPPQSRQSTEA
jgi:hypothetical protein